MSVHFLRDDPTDTKEAVALEDAIELAKQDYREAFKAALFIANAYAAIPSCRASVRRAYELQWDFIGDHVLPEAREHIDSHEIAEAVWAEYAPVRPVAPEPRSFFETACEIVRPVDEIARCIDIISGKSVL